MTCLQVKRMTLTLTTILIIDSCHLGRGGGVTAGDASTSTTRDLKIASLFHHLWTDSAAPYKKGISITYMSPPPPLFISVEGGGGGGGCRRQVKTRSTARGVLDARNA